MEGAFHFQVLHVLRNHLPLLYTTLLSWLQVAVHIDVQYFHAVIFSPLSLDTIVYESSTPLDLYCGLDPIPRLFENGKKFSFFRAFVASKF
jgi:hypothetical protein